MGPIKVKVSDNILHLEYHDPLHANTLPSMQILFIIVVVFFIIVSKMPKANLRTIKVNW